MSLTDPQDSTNDVGRGSFNFILVKTEFSKSYNLLTAMLGTDYDNSSKISRKGKKSHKKKRISTILGFIITIRKDVLEQREALQIIWEDIEKGVYSNVLPGSVAIKRKREDEPKHYFFTALSTDDEEDEEELRLSKKSRRT